MDDDKSFIKLHRKMLKWEWYNDNNTKILFIHLLLIANWEDKRWEGIIIKRGQVVTGRKKLSKETGLTEQQIRTSLNKLISTNEITIDVTNKYSLITIEKYGNYQQREERINQQNNHQSNQQVTNNQPTNNQQVTTTKEYKENKEYKEINNSSSNSIYDFVEKNLGRTLSPLEYEEISSWKDNELTRYAIKKSFLNGKYTLAYVKSILNYYKKNNISTIKEAMQAETNFKKRKVETKQTEKKERKDNFIEVLKEIEDGSIILK
ncbi:MAG: DnaD domain protein [Bacilli bacterium]|nr:DnaD domain protein [Bacilli bacterium]